MTVAEVLKHYNEYQPVDAFRYWLMSSNIGSPSQRTRLSVRMAKAYKDSPAHWLQQDIDLLYQEAQW